MADPLVVPPRDTAKVANKIGTRKARVRRCPSRQLTKNCAFWMRGCMACADTLCSRTNGREVERCAGPLHRFGNFLHDCSDTALLQVSHDDASDPTSGLAHEIQTDSLHHFNGHLRPDELLGHLPQHRVVPKAVKDDIQVLGGPHCPPFRLFRKHFKNLSWSRRTAGLCRIKSSCP